MSSEDGRIEELVRATGDVVFRREQFIYPRCTSGLAIDRSQITRQQHMGCNHFSRATSLSGVDAEAHVRAQREAESR